MAGKLQGQVVEVDASGNLVTDIMASQLDGVPTDDRVAVSCDGHVTAGIYPPDHQQPEMTLLAVLQNDQRLALTLVGESASQFLGIRAGAVVVVKWRE